MPKKNDRYVVPHSDGWAVKASEAGRACSVHNTQDQARAAAKEMVRNLGGGEVLIQGKNGQWRVSDTVDPGNDPPSRIDRT